MALKENQMKKYLSMLMILTMVLQSVPVALAGTGPIVTDQYTNNGKDLLGFKMPAAKTTSTNQNFFTGKVNNRIPVRTEKNPKNPTYIRAINNQGNQFYISATKGPLTNLGQSYYLKSIQDTRGVINDPKYANYLTNTQSGQNGSQQNQGYQQNNGYMTEADKQREQRRWEMTFGANQANRTEDRKFALLEKQLAQQNAQMLNQAAMQNAAMNEQRKQQNMDRVMNMTMITFGMFAQMKTQKNEQKAYQHEQDANRAFYQQKDQDYYAYLRQQNRYAANDKYKQPTTNVPSWMSQSSQY